MSSLLRSVADGDYRSKKYFEVLFFFKYSQSVDN